jgi:tellurite methyltransferase
MTGADRAGGESARDRWNERHARGVPSEEPAAWLAEQRPLLERHSRGPALDIACGNGRNAIFLAELGFTVDALDISDVAIERVSRVATERALPIRARRVDLTRLAAFPHPPYQLVIDFFYLERPLFGPISETLAPGGILLFQTFVGERPAFPARSFGPRFGLEPGELRRAFAALELLQYDEVEIGDDHAGRRTVARLVARGPESVSSRGRFRACSLT